MAELKNDDWRLFFQDKYLMNIRLLRMSYHARNRGGDHAHCEFCWAKFSEQSGDLNQGYVTEDGVYWICETCYNDFKEMFNWTPVD